MSVLIWVHSDCLDPHSSALQQYANRPAAFVFDEDLLAHYHLSLKRIVFMYECLLEIPDIQIRKGDVLAELLNALQEHDCERIATVASVAPYFAQIVAGLRQQNIAVEILPAPAFVKLSPSDEERLDLKRFSRYWQQVKRQVLSLNESLF